MVARRLRSYCGQPGSPFPANDAVNVVFFRYFEDAGHRYLARTWLIEQDRTPEPADGSTSKSKEPWNGRGWYVAFGEHPPDGRSWQGATKYGFVSAGGGEWYSRSIRKLPVGARIFTYIPKAGYVGVGVVTGEPMPFPEAVLDIDGQQRNRFTLDQLAAEFGLDDEGAAELD